MQTFLPYPEFERTAQVLDRLRLGKQRVECLQILRTLTGVTDGWRNHPAVTAWRGHEAALLRYGQVICAEWRSRGYHDNCEAAMLNLDVPAYIGGLTPLPDWFCEPRIFASHRSNLLRKDPTWYGQFGWTEGPDLPYVWPREVSWAS